MATAGTQYTKDNKFRAELSREKSAQGRDIGELPPVENQARRDAAARDFQLFCETYQIELFSREWSTDHLTIISKIEAAVLHGWQFGMAMPRGSGKTTLCYVACEWALLYGHRSFVVLIGAEATAAQQNAASGGETSAESVVQRWFAENARVYVNPGSSYGTGGAGNMRMNIATTRGLVERALENIAEALTRA